MGTYRYCISLGSNLGDKAGNIENALQFLNTQPLTLIRQSGLYASDAWGYDSVNAFVNACALIETDLGPEHLLELIKSYEGLSGRTKGNEQGYADRLIDLDILLADALVLINDSIQIPHPHMHKRNFVLLPLNEICADFIHPVINKTISQLAHASTDESKVVRIK